MTRENKPVFFPPVDDFIKDKCAWCKHFRYQNDRNGHVAITFCSHPDNNDSCEGNTNEKVCPLYNEGD